MAERCRAYFEEAQRLGGLVAKMRLASLAQLTSTEAASVEDRPELLELLETSMVRLRQEFANGDGTSAGSPVAVQAARAVGEEVRALRRHLATYVELMTQRSLFAGDLEATVRRVTEAATTGIDVERASVWFLDEKRTRISCADLFERAPRKHSKGLLLSAEDYAPYFAALDTERTVAASDALHDPRTSCFATHYLAPLGITSMLDVPIWVGGKMVGVVCHEHVGKARTWTADEETFAYLMSNFVALAHERRRAG
ncbi:MAG: GAF domain-containing protein [Polyangiaceae bacterium]